MSLFLLNGSKCSFSNNIIRKRKIFNKKIIIYLYRKFFFDPLNYFWAIVLIKDIFIQFRIDPNYATKWWLCYTGKEGETRKIGPLNHYELLFEDRKTKKWNWTCNWLTFYSMIYYYFIFLERKPLILYPFLFLFKLDFRDKSRILKKLIG